MCPVLYDVYLNLVFTVDFGEISLNNPKELKRIKGNNTYRGENTMVCKGRKIKKDSRKKKKK